jgi:hypothetical protein
MTKWDNSRLRGYGHNSFVDDTKGIEGTISN